MTDILLHPAAVSGIARVPASKSYVHRLMIVSALSGHRLTIKGSLKSKDIEATANCLKALGAKVGIGENSIEIAPPARFKPALLDAAESGSTLRMLLPVIPVLGVEATFTGRGRLPQRPVSDVVGVLKKAGARVEGESLPIKVGGGYATKVFEIENPVSASGFGRRQYNGKRQTAFGRIRFHDRRGLETLRRRCGKNGRWVRSRKRIYRISRGSRS